MELKSLKNQEFVNSEFFDSRRQVGEGFVEKLVEVFSDEAPKLINKIKQEAEDSDDKEMAELGHKLKGMSMNVGATRLSELGLEIEKIAKDGDREGLVRILELLDATLDSTLDTMRSLLETGSD